MNIINAALATALILVCGWQLSAVTGSEEPLFITQWWHLPVLAATAPVTYWLMHALTPTKETKQGWKRIILGVAVPFIFALWCIYAWEAVIGGFRIPRVLIPPPSGIAAALFNNLNVLYGDFVQTFVRSVIPGYILGCGAGFMVALVSWRLPSLARGLLPLGNFMSVMPIVGVAPIMVMWFGFDWQSKAAVVVTMTFFPMMINTLSGLAEATQRERDLIHTYAAPRARVLMHLLLPRASPFIFNGLKICSTLALIGAIVAEFFGTPIVGMGFRISSEVGRMNMDLVWATIVVSAIVGSTAYGSLALAERMITFWHPSLRTRRETV